MQNKNLSLCCSIVNSLPSMIIVVDMNLKVLFVNNLTKKRMNINFDDDIQHDLSEYFHQNLNQIELLKKAIERWEFDEVIRVKEKNENKIHYFDVHFFPLNEHQNEKKYILIQISDVTEQEKTELELQRSLRLDTIGTLASGLAHDFNNVLGGIVGTISLLKYKFSKNDDISKEKLKSYFETMEESSTRASNMVQQLLSLSKKREFNFAPVDLNLSIKHVMKIAETTFDKSVKLEAEFADKSAVVNADPQQIEQVILNFCVNAEHSMTIMRSDDANWGGVLSVSLTKIEADRFFCKNHPEAHQKEYWMVSVKDTGVGIKKELLGNIFTPFFTTKDNQKKSGLGLATVYNIIHQHNGFIDVYSEFGVGSTFNFYLPFVKQSISTKNISKKIKFDNKGCVLVIDDEIVVRKTIGDMVEECGFNVLFAENGEEALKIYKEKYKNIDLIFLDMAMPKMSGKETYIKIKEINLDSRIILASGFRQDSRVQKVIDMGVEAYIQKPFTFETLSSAILKSFEKKPK